MDGWMDGRTDGWMDDRRQEGMVAQMDGHLPHIYISHIHPCGVKP